MKTTEQQDEALIRAYRELVMELGGDHEGVGVALLAALLDARGGKARRRRKGAGRPKAEGNPIPEQYTIDALALEAADFRARHRVSGRDAALWAVSKAVCTVPNAVCARGALQSALANEAIHAEIKRHAKNVAKKMPKCPKS